LIGDVQNTSQYFVQFLISFYNVPSLCDPFPAANVPQSAWLDITNIAAGNPVTVTLELTQQTIFNPVAGPRPNVNTLATGVGAPIPLQAPIQCDVYSTYTGNTATFGVDTDTDGTLLYSVPSSIALPRSSARGTRSLRTAARDVGRTDRSVTTSANNNFVLTPIETTATTIKTGKRNTVLSSDGRQLRAIPTGVGTNKYTLMWAPLASSQGFAVPYMTIYSTAACLGCYTTPTVPTLLF